MPIKINVKSVFVYIIYAAACVFLNGAASGVPLSLGLYFSLLICGGNAVASPVLYAACSAVHADLTASLCALAEAAFLLAVVLIYRRTGKKMRFEAAVWCAIALAPFVALSDRTLPVLEDLSPYAVRAIAAAAVLLFFVFCYKGVYACVFRLGRCRLKEDEIFCLAAVYAGIGTGFINLAGEFAYMALCAFALSFSARFFRGPASLIVAIAAGIPLAVTELSLTPVTLCVCALMCAYGYTINWFSQGAALAAVRAVTICICCILAAIPSERWLKALYDALTVRTFLAGTAVNRERERAGEKLFRMSEVFREVESAFKDMDEGADEAGAKRRVAAELKERLCLKCEKRARCEKSVVYTGFARLVEAGTLKGKVNLIDLPPAVTQNCTKPADAIKELNLLLAEYRRYMTEAENARGGRQLLADQARGISAVLKNNAVDMCRELKTDAGENIARALAQCGIMCPEAAVSGDENPEITAIIVGKADLPSAIKAIYRATGAKFILKDKIALGGEKNFYIFCRPPKYDAVFGVASAKKSGEAASGDTHSVIRINEHRFLMALSDGMGSGGHACKISRTAISLIEAFYRAEMPEGTVLETINKLLAFTGEERFACIDICSVDLGNGSAEFVKIGAPAALIMRGGDIKVLESQSLPLGILEGLRPTVAQEKLCDGDMLVFMSDGITSAFNSTPELLDFLQPMRPLNPQNLADKLLAGALERTDGKAEDDMTVLCTRIFATDPAEEQEPLPAAV